MTSFSVQALEFPMGSLSISTRSVCRYLGLGGRAPDAALLALVESCVREVQAAAHCRACRMVTPVRIAEDAADFGALSVPGGQLARHLRGCDRAILFAATIGAESELLRRRAAVTSPARALVLDAAGTAAIEAFCDALCDRWQAEFSDAFLRPRFSPGYGDVPLAVQRPLLSCLDSGRSAGITLTDSLLMLPQKSVSAIVGIGKSGCIARVHDCGQCDQRNCAFRLQEQL